MPKLRLEFDAEWSREKIAWASVQFKREFGWMRGVSNYTGLQVVGDAAPSRPIGIELECRNNAFGRKCGARWTAPSFTPCPKCSHRRYVHKVETGEPEPDAAIQVNVPIEESS